MRSRRFVALMAVAIALVLGCTGHDPALPRRDQRTTEPPRTLPTACDGRERHWRGEHWECR